MVKIPCDIHTTVASVSALNSRMPKWTSCISDAWLFPWAICYSEDFKGFSSSNLTDPWAHWNVNKEDIFNSSKLSPQKKMFYHLVQISYSCLQNLLLQRSWVCSFFPLLSMNLLVYMQKEKKSAAAVWSLFQQQLAYRRNRGLKIAVLLTWVQVYSLGMF